MTRLVRTSFAVLAALAGLVLACSDTGESTCPGEPVGSFRLEVSLPDGAPESACTAVPPVTDPPTRIVASFQAKLTAEPAAAGSWPAALCPGGRGATYYGSRAADGTYTLEASSGLAVLDRCGPNCSVSAVEHVTGTVTGEGAAATFTGTLEERFEYLAGNCGSCALPCAATYALTSAPSP
ncbi:MULTISPECIES: hypothetical protein [unclassified Anaeromyxobacter]|uniref:hypothetical protein n=1 Tax=unclassified Anaeromyxobacter TaxID=2620896 RepID=UPI001F562AB7|nr:MULTISPECIES: hypothetical protein [unclassified Anaeromyxobacter]